MNVKTRPFFSALLSAALVVISAASATGEPPEWSGSPDVATVIETLPGMMRYDTAEIEAAPGAKVKLTLKNPDDLQHNLVLLKPDAADKDGQKFSQEVWQLGDKGIQLGWVPTDHPRILIASKLLDPESSEDLYFVAPEQAGDYPFVCTVPGHSMLMKGILTVQKPGAVLEDLKYSIYEGKWSKLPDFSTLTPVKTGKLKDGLIDLGVARKIKGPFGIVFEGKLRVENEEDVRFYLASDDGSRLIVDGEGIIDADGIHPLKDPIEAREHLLEGVHTVRVPYFDGGGQRGLTLSVRSKSFGHSVLSTDIAKGKAKTAAPKPILLTPKNGEAIVHRAFFADASPRAIAVGYPGGVNLVWDADRMNLVQLWRGGFLDVAPHWNGRGSSSSLAGFDRVHLGGGVPIQVLKSLDEPWRPLSRGHIKYERDTAEPQKEIEFDLPEPGYQFSGYQLDADNRFPTFRYRYNDEIKVEETFQPDTIDGSEALVRTIQISGKVAPDSYFRIANSPKLNASDGSEWVDADKILIKLEGGKPVVRSIDGQSELIAALDSAADKSTLTITYRWKTKVGGKKN